MVLYGLRWGLMTYREMYFYLYRNTADALACFYAGNVIEGIYTLEQAQRETEEMALETDIIKDKP